VTALPLPYSPDRARNGHGKGFRLDLADHLICSDLHAHLLHARFTTDLPRWDGRVSPRGPVEPSGAGLPG
jgi:hypothetical protein